MTVLPVLLELYLLADSRDSASVRRMTKWRHIQPIPHAVTPAPPLTRKPDNLSFFLLTL